MTRSVVFRIDAGPGIGLGHLQRGLALAEALRRHDCRCTFVAPDLPAVRRRMASANIELVPLETADFGSSRDTDLVRQTVSRHHAQVAVIDAYRADPGLPRSLQSEGARTVVFEDFGREIDGADVVVNAAPLAPGAAIPGSHGPVRLLGPSYAVLHPLFWSAPRRHVREDVRIILITVGGDDPRGLCSRLVQWIDSLSGDFTIAVAAGPFANPPHMVTRHPLRFVDAPETLFQALCDSDIAVCGAGQTLYEALAIGEPVVAVQLFDNQAMTLAGFVNAGVVQSAGSADDEQVQGRVCAAVSALLRNAEARERLSVAAQSLVDGQGAMRVAREVCKL